MPRWTSILAALALGSTLAACASSADTGFPDPTEIPTKEPGASCTEPSEEEVELEGEILVLDSCYRPQHAVVAAGEEVTWTQEGVLPHNVVFVDLDVDSHPDCSGSEPGSCMADGDSFSHAFEETGEFAYYCVIHGTPDGAGMAGTLIVG